MNDVLPHTPTPGIDYPPGHAGTHREVLENTYVNRRHDLLRFLGHYGVNHADAEEITHDVFARAFEPEREMPGNLFAWLLTCARNLARKRFHRARREATQSDARWRVWETRSSWIGTSVHEELERRERIYAVRSALRELNPLEAECLILRSRGMTFREIGERLGIPLRRASYLTTSALEKMDRLVKTRS